MDRVRGGIQGALALGAWMSLGGGCATDVWFTQPLREAYELGVVPRSAAPPGEHEGIDDGAVDPAASVDDDGNPVPPPTPAELQYFVSDRLVLEREVTSRDDSLAHGRIRVRRGRFVEKVVVRRNTPGVAVDWGRDWVAISFEEGNALVFAVDDAREDPDDDTYQLRVSEDPERGRVETALEGRRYVVRMGEGARLEVRRDSRTKRSRQRRVLHGRRLAERGE